jgi:hypothetical protein
MSLIKKELIEEAFEKYDNEFFGSLLYYELNDAGGVEVAKEDFRAGVRFAESQLEELATEYVDYIYDNNFDNFGRNKLSPKELFQQFIKERNENT